MIIVDDLKAYPNCKLPYKTWCHMMTDSLAADGLEELHAMAVEIGLKRGWFQDSRTMPHYDLVPSKRALAVVKGAIPMDGLEMARRCWRGKGELLPLRPSE